MPPKAPRGTLFPTRGAVGAGGSQLGSGWQVIALWTRTGALAGRPETPARARGFGNPGWRHGSGPGCAWSPRTGSSARALVRDSLFVGGRANQTCAWREKRVVRRGSRWRYWVRDQFDACLTFFANRVRARGGASRCPGGVINPAADPAAAAEQREPVLQHLSGPSPCGNVVATRQRAHELLWHGG